MGLLEHNPNVREGTSKTAMPITKLWAACLPCSLPFPCPCSPKMLLPNKVSADKVFIELLLN